MTKLIGKLTAFGLLLFGLGCYDAARAQRADEYYNKTGRLNVWTTEGVLRNKTGNAPELGAIRFGKHEGYDRLVFEMKGELIGYYVTYDEPFLADGEGQISPPRGKTFAKVSLYPISSTNENVEANDRIVARQNKTAMPVIRGIKQLEWFEGELSYVIGLKRRTPFRVQVLSNPTRLVVDFKQ